MATLLHIESFQAMTSSILPILADSAVKGVLILALAWFAAWRMRRSPASIRHMVWFVALSSLVAMPVLGRVLPAWQILPASWDLGMMRLPEQAPVASRVPIAPLPMQTPLPDIDVGSLPARPALPPSAQPLHVSADVPAAASEHDAATAWTWAVLAWAAVAGILLMRIFLGWLYLLWLGMRLPRCDAPAWHAVLQQCQAQMGARSTVRLLQGDARAMPMTWGIFAPKLLVPSNASGWLSDRRRVVLLHELAHIQRQDCLTQLIAEIACAIHWFNPLAWLASKRMQAEAERACDDRVLSAGSRPADYAEHLLQIASHQGRILAAAAMTAIPMARPSRLEGRLLAILDDKCSRRALTLGVVVLALVGVACLIVPLSMLHAAPAEVRGPSDTKTSTTLPAPLPPVGGNESDSKAMQKPQLSALTRRHLDRLGLSVECPPDWIDITAGDKGDTVTLADPHPGPGEVQAFLKLSFNDYAGATTVALDLTSKPHPSATVNRIITVDGMPARVTGYRLPDVDGESLTLQVARGSRVYHADLGYGLRRREFYLALADAIFTSIRWDEPGSTTQPSPATQPVVPAESPSAPPATPSTQSADGDHSPALPTMMDANRREEKNFYVMGTFRPGVFSMSGRTVTLAQAVTAAGGLKPESRFIHLLRPNSQGRLDTIAAYPVEKMPWKQSELLQHGDVVYVSTESLAVSPASQPWAPSGTVQVTGGVQRPGTFDVSACSTLLRVLVAAGMDTSHPHSVYTLIFRTFPDGRRGPLGSFAVADILQGRIADPPLQSRDVIQVEAYTSGVSPDSREVLVATWRKALESFSRVRVQMETLKARYEAIEKGGLDKIPLTQEMINTIEADPQIAKAEMRRCELLEERQSLAARKGEAHRSAGDFDQRIAAVEQELQQLRQQKLDDFRRTQVEQLRLDMLAAVEEVTRLNRNLDVLRATARDKGISGDLEPEMANERLMLLASMRTEARARLEALRSQYEVYQKAGLEKVPLGPEALKVVEADPIIVNLMTRHRRLVEDRQALEDRQKKGESVAQDLQSLDKRIEFVDRETLQMRLQKIDDFRRMRLEQVRLDMLAAEEQVKANDREYQEAEAAEADAERLYGH